VTLSDARSGDSIQCLCAAVTLFVKYQHTCIMAAINLETMSRDELLVHARKLTREVEALKRMRYIAHILSAVFAYHPMHQANLKGSCRADADMLTQ
jgi:hypothetical protein